MIEFELPFPPSLNHYYRHVGSRVLISREGRRYRELVVSKVKSEGLSGFHCQVELNIELYPPDNRRRDVDNILKVVLDSFTDAGLYEDDSHVMSLSVVKRSPLPPDGLVFVRISEYDLHKQTEKN